MRLIDADKTEMKVKQLKTAAESVLKTRKYGKSITAEIDLASACYAEKLLELQPTVDAVPINVIESWLYSIAMNNVDNSLGDACEEIILRLNGLVRYNADWKDGGSDG